MPTIGSGLGRSGLASALALGCSSFASAAVVFDPVPNGPARGLTVGIQRFVTIPASSANAPTRARIQYATPTRDGSGRLFVNDTRGILYRTDTAGAAPRTYLDLRSANVNFLNFDGESGLLGVAFHPNFNGTRGQAGYGVMYAHYTATRNTGRIDYLANDNASHDSVVREFTIANPGDATPEVSASREVLRVGHFAGNHNGGTIAFNQTAAPGTADYGKLYIGFGDGGGANDPRDYAQALGNPLGKILRIAPADPDGAGPLRYGVPGDNPFTGQQGALGEIWAYGLRNPQQFSWDSTGRMFITDIGQDQVEEVDIGEAGANYGWVAREGTFAKSADKGDGRVFDLPADDADFNYDYPVAQYDHDEGRSIGGGFVYEGDALPALRGLYLLTDNPTGRIFYFDPDAARGQDGTIPLSELFLTLDGDAFTFLAEEGYNNRVDLRFGIDELGELYMLTKRDGDIYRFAAQVAAVPEPASWAIMIAGVGLVGGALRTRRHRAVPTS